MVEGEVEEIVREKEQKFFEAKKAEWLEKYRDKYILIKGEVLPNLCMMVVVCVFLRGEVLIFI